jgi:8-oxo-dGTP pyrophosphatase MutT (NUDIX family)
MREATLCLLVRENPSKEVLLGFKKAGFGAGKYTGIGGKVNPGETVSEAAVRELEEETGIRALERDLQPVGHLTFRFPARPMWSQVVHVFLIDAWQGDPAEGDEVRPCWFSPDEIPYDQMWQDSAYWLPPILVGKRIRASFTFRDDNETVAGLDVETWDPNGESVGRQDNG